MGKGASSHMVDYLQNVTGYLTQALNDQGPPGTLPRSVTNMQIEYLGGMSTLTTHVKDKKLLRVRKHFYLAHQYTLQTWTWDSPGYQVNQQASQLQDLLSKIIICDPLLLGQLISIFPRRSTSPMSTRNSPRLHDSGHRTW